MSRPLLKPSEVRFWQEAFCAYVSARAGYACAAEGVAGWADEAVRQFRLRFENPGDRPDSGRL